MSLRKIVSRAILLFISKHSLNIALQKSNLIVNFQSQRVLTDKNLYCYRPHCIVQSYLLAQNYILYSVLIFVHHMIIIIRCCSLQSILCLLLPFFPLAIELWPEIQVIEYTKAPATQYNIFLILNILGHIFCCHFFLATYSL